MRDLCGERYRNPLSPCETDTFYIRQKHDSTNMEKATNCDSGIIQQSVVVEVLSDECPAQLINRDLDPPPSNSTTKPNSEFETPNVEIISSPDSINKVVESPAQTNDHDQNLLPSNNSTTEPNSESETHDVSVTYSVENEKVVKCPAQCSSIDQDLDLPPSSNSLMEPISETRPPNVQAVIVDKVLQSRAQGIDQDLCPPFSNKSTTEPTSDGETPNVSIIYSRDRVNNAANVKDISSAESVNNVVGSAAQSIEHGLDPSGQADSATEPNLPSEVPDVPITCPTESVNKSVGSTDLKEEVMKAIERDISQLEDIPDVIKNIPIECFSENTQRRLCQSLDPESYTQTDGGLTKDYMGFGEWIGLDPQFMRYLHRTKMIDKTLEVLGKWITFEGDPRSTIGNFRDCMMNGIERPDVVTDLAETITRDAIAWVRSRNEACTIPQAKTDKSWQLTRHDVVTGKKTYYTACLVYADEDEGMALIITKLYKTVWKEALFFLPQFDLKRGKYVFDTTARVIEERCDGRVVFILSEYFFASEVCRFAVQFAKANDAAAEAGNLIPFHLTNKLDHVPTVLKGISGIRWFRPAARRMAWCTMTDTVLGGRINQDRLENVRSEMLENIEKEPSVYLCDPPYDEGTKPPGPPIEVDDSTHTGSDPITSDSNNGLWQGTLEDLSLPAKPQTKLKFVTHVRRFFQFFPNKFRTRKRSDQHKCTEEKVTQQSSHEKSDNCGNSFRIPNCSSTHKSHNVQWPNSSGDIKPLSNDNGKVKDKLKETVERASPETSENGVKTDSIDCVETSDKQVRKGDTERRQNNSNRDEVNINFNQPGDESECGCPNLVSVKVEFHRSRSEPVENDESTP